jgi:Tol biopolymer transport system component
MGKGKVIAFSSGPRIGLIDVAIRSDGDIVITGAERRLDFGIPGQARWGLGPVIDEKRLIVTSYEDGTITNLVNGQVLTHNWIYDLATGVLEEILVKERLAPFQYGSAILPDGRIVVNAMLDGEERIFTTDLDGRNVSALTTAGDGFCYGVRLSPDGERLAFHVTAGKSEKEARLTWFRPGPYSINSLRVDGTERVLVAGKPGHLYFGPDWSPDGEWLAYLDCHCEEDPPHFWADICIGRSDGSEQRVVTTGQSHWFGTTFGTRERRGGGSNLARWTPDGKYVTYTRVAPGSHPDCEYNPELPDHRECVYRPELARGGSQVCLLEPFKGEVIEVTGFEENRWDFRPVFSPDGQYIVFTRARVGQPSELWVSDVRGKSQRLLSRGWDGYGADMGRWLA